MMSETESKAVQAQIDFTLKAMQEQLANIIMRAAINKAKAQ
jgi:hypothetical protein